MAERAKVFPFSAISVFAAIHLRLDPKLTTENYLENFNVETSTHPLPRMVLTSYSRLTP
jgi:hypothetical protein